MLLLFDLKQAPAKALQLYSGGTCTCAVTITLTHSHSACPACDTSPLRALRKRAPNVSDHTPKKLVPAEASWLEVQLQRSLQALRQASLEPCA